VLLAEVLAALKPRDGETYLDGTFGAGGYTRGILAAADCKVIALDRDPNAIRDGQAMVAEFGGRLTLIETPFSEMEEAVAQSGGFASEVESGPREANPTQQKTALLDGIVLDIGVSSMQLDQAERGFSFRFAGPLDMRMAQDGESAADLVNTRSEAELADIFYHYGEERLARSIARAIVHDRKDKPFETTKDLADLIGRIVHSKPGDIHPATRSFQALRIAVNDELNELANALHAAERLLKPGGRLVVVSFHSLEDRIVKVFLAARSGRGGGSRHAPVQGVEAPTFRLETRGAITATDEECRANPRARSAKLRAGIRTDAPALRPDAQVIELARLPDQPARKGGKRR
jgi:16S rRNA (cytosine1402-N4)-methyltransferase